MKKLIVMFFILFIVLLLARVVFAFYVDTVPVFAALLTPLICLSAIAVALMLVFTGLLIYKEFKHKGD